MNPGAKGAGVPRGKRASQSAVGTFYSLMHQLGTDDDRRAPAEPRRFGVLGGTAGPRAGHPVDYSLQSAPRRGRNRELPQPIEGSRGAAEQVEPAGTGVRAGAGRPAGGSRRGRGAAGRGGAGRGSGSSRQRWTHSTGAALRGGRLSEAASSPAALRTQHGFRQFPPHLALFHLREEKVP